MSLSLLKDSWGHGWAGRLVLPPQKTVCDCGAGCKWNYHVNYNVLEWETDAGIRLFVMWGNLQLGVKFHFCVTMLATNVTITAVNPLSSHVTGFVSPGMCCM